MNAVMIMCHKNWEQAQRLIAHMRSPETDIFIHMDSKAADWTQPAPEAGIYYAKKRYSGKLFDPSLVDIELELIGRVKEVERAEGKHYQYYLLLSGQDYPLRHISYINDQLRRSYPEPFMDCIPRNGENFVFRAFRGTASLRRNHQLVNAVKSPLLRFPLRVIFFSKRIFLERFRLTLYDYFRKRSIEVYGGSQWWIIPDDLMDFIWAQRNTKWARKLRDSAFPDETWFHTVAMRSPMADRIRIQSPDRWALACKTWVYFWDEGKPPTGHPYNFTVQQYDRLVNSAYWFARKFDISEDSQILDLLDEHLKRQEFT